MGKGFAKQKKQAKMMQEKFSELQEKMLQMEVEGQAGNGLVTVRLNGENDLKSIIIKPECVDPEDVEGLQDLIKAAFTDAQNKIKAQSPLGGGVPDLSKGFPNLSQFGF